MIRNNNLFRFVRKYAELKEAGKVRVKFNKLNIILARDVFNEEGEKAEDATRVSRPALEKFLEKVQQERIRLDQIMNDAQLILNDFDQAEVDAREAYEDQLRRGVRTPE